MRELTARSARARTAASAVSAGRDAQAHARILIELDEATGPRLKYFSRTADVEYWTDLWRDGTHLSYAREARGHLAHQLRDTFRRWVEPGSRTLEAGCGPGRFTVAAHALGYRAEGLDWSAEIIEWLRAQFPAIPWHVGDVRHLDFASESFDAVYSPGVCEHFEEGPDAVLEETRRLLRPGGIAVISTPCFNAWMQRHIRPDADNGHAQAPFYQYAFTPDGMAGLLSRLGFEVEDIRPYAVLDTLTRYGGWRVPARLRNVIALTLDYLPVIRNWGSTCIWVARKR